MNEKNEQNIEGQSPSRILVVDDHAIVRKGLALLVNQEPDLSVCAEAESADEALVVLESRPVDLAIVDISLNGMNGIQLTEKIKSKYPDLPVLILTMHDEAIYAKLAFRAGAGGYITKQEAAEAIVPAIRMMLRNESYISGSVAQKMSARK
jgi:DNA-binding NarL/FixJ family response regulator